MKIFYLASPYSHPDEYMREIRFEDACKATGQLLKKGISVFCPIAHTHPIAVINELGLGFDFWSEFDKEMIRRCDGLIIAEIDGWVESAGVFAETQYALGLGLSIQYYNPETEVLSLCPTRNTKTSSTTAN